MTLSGTVMNTAIVLSLTGVSAMLLYLALRKRDDDDDVDHGNSSARRMIEPSNVTKEITIPRDSVGIVIGRQGCNIKSIQEKTKTRIKFKDDGAQEGPRVCLLTGSNESVLYAQSLIQDLIRNQPLITTSEMWVPAKAIGRIIGRCGENIHAVITSSGAKVNVDNVTPKDKYAPRRILFKGTVDQISVAKSLIETKVAEDDELRKRYEAGAANRSPRKNKSPQFLMGGDRVEAEDEAPHAERLDPINSDESLEVYMSAVESPGQFWVQILSPSAAELDQLVQQMTDYYSKLENQELHVLHEVSLGQLVAAPFHQDKKWYRAQVVNVTVNDYDPEESEVELYYVDYGDSFDIEQRQLMELRTDFLKLRPQAIECSLAKVSPVGGKWTDEATDLFEELTENAQWKVIICKVDHYDPTIQRKQDRGRREGSPVPVVELFNVSGTKDINVGDELVKNQFAVYKNSLQAAAKPVVREPRAQSEKKEHVRKLSDDASLSTSRSEVGIKFESSGKMAADVSEASHSDEAESSDRSSSKISPSPNQSGPRNKMAADALEASRSDNAESSDRSSSDRSSSDRSSSGRSSSEISPSPNQSGTGNKMAADALKANYSHAENAGSGDRSSSEISQSPNQSEPSTKSRPRNKMAADALRAINSHAESIKKSSSEISPSPNHPGPEIKSGPRSRMAADALKVIKMHASMSEEANKPSGAKSRGSNQPQVSPKEKHKGKMAADALKAANSSPDCAEGSSRTRHTNNGGEASTNGRTK